MRPTAGRKTSPSGRLRVQVRQSLHALLHETTQASAALGYTLATISFGARVEVTLEKGGATFVLWLTPRSDEQHCYRKTARFNIGHQGEAPDQLGYALLDAACTQIEAWERSLPEGAQMQLFDRAPLPRPEQEEAPVDSAAATLLTQASFTPIYQEWLEVRERRLQARFAGLQVGSRKNILLVNATKGLQFFASIVDFVALLQRTQDKIRATSASYFPDIFQFQQGVADKGLQVVSVAEVTTWGAAEVNRFDAVIFLGPSDVMVRLMALDGVTAKLVLLDLGFYHQLLEAYPGWYPGAGVVEDIQIIRNLASQRNGVVAYSCQPERKIRRDLVGVCAPHLLVWRWFDYIPIGFTYRTYYRSDRHAFDVALLGSAGRNYDQIDAGRFRGRRFLFLGNAESVPAIEHLRAQLDLIVVSRVDEEAYSRLLALCRCVVLPFSLDSANVFLSVADTIASGKALVTTRHMGIARLGSADLPMVFYDTSASDLFRGVDDLLQHNERLEDIHERSVAFAKEKLDIYRILEVILDEQVR
jgi:hypothetical protein